MSRDACIKRFEFTFEVSWKLLKVFLYDEGFTCSSPRFCFKQAHSIGLIEDNEDWLNMIHDRNDSVQTYSEELADELYQKLNNYLLLFVALEKGIIAYQKSRKIIPQFW
ncbi:MAG: HI0074 family nucleotidyltransferase substrate-binding subunit, partial [Flavobacteriales bacterium]